ncbi:MAG: ABC transporter ATP-binding protein [Sulfolobaceae archaeon]
MLKLMNINVNINGKIILSDISFIANKGINIILGPNGSGKTTLLRAMIDMVKYEGKIIIEGEKSYIPAEFFSPKMKVIDVILAGNKKANYMYFIKRLNLEKFLDRDFSSLSSGEKKLILIAKALAEGENVIMDEPLSNLDIRNKYNIIKILKEINKTFIITSHELDVLKYADKIILLSEGRLKFEGRLDDLSEDLLSDVYKIKIKKINLQNEAYFMPSD